MGGQYGRLSVFFIGGRPADPPPSGNIRHFTKQGRSDTASIRKDFRKGDVTVAVLIPSSLGRQLLHYIPKRTCGRVIVFASLKNSEVATRQTAKPRRLQHHKKNFNNRKIPSYNIRENDFRVHSTFKKDAKKMQKRCKKTCFLYCQFKTFSYLCSANKQSY